MQWRVTVNCRLKRWRPVTTRRVICYVKNVTHWDKASAVVTFIITSERTGQKTSVRHNERPKRWVAFTFLETLTDCEMTEWAAICKKSHDRTAGSTTRPRTQRASRRDRSSIAEWVYGQCANDHSQVLTFALVSPVRFEKNQSKA